MSSILIVNGAKPFLLSKGEFNDTFVNLMLDPLKCHSHDIMTAGRASTRPRNTPVMGFAAARNICYPSPEIPLKTLDDPEHFFKGFGVEVVYLHIH